MLISAFIVLGNTFSLMSNAVVIYLEILWCNICFHVLSCAKFDPVLFFLFFHSSFLSLCMPFSFSVFREAVWRHVLLVGKKKKKLKKISRVNGREKNSLAQTQRKIWNARFACFHGNVETNRVLGLRVMSSLSLFKYRLLRERWVCERFKNNCFYNSWDSFSTTLKLAVHNYTTNYSYEGVSPLKPCRLWNARSWAKLFYFKVASETTCNFNLRYS